MTGVRAPLQARARHRSRGDRDVAEKRNRREDDRPQERGRQGVRREPPERDEGDHGGSREGDERPQRQCEEVDRDGGGSAQDRQRRPPGAPKSADGGDADDDAEAEDDAEQVPVEGTVHARESSRVPPYPRRIDLGAVLAIGILVLLVVPVLSRRALQARRARALRALERARGGTRLIALIHRQETVGVLGVPFYRFIDIEDSEAVLRVVRQTPDEAPLDLLLHTPGGLVLASEQIAYALKTHTGKVTVLVPHYAMSGGTLLALAADEIRMDEAAVLGPVDPQLGDVPAAALVRVAAAKPIEQLDDRTLLMADVAEKALRHMKQVVTNLVIDRMGADKAETLAEELAGGHYTHDDPITVPEARALGLPVVVGLPREAYDLMELFPQEGRRRPSVQFVPLPGNPERSRSA